MSKTGRKERPAKAATHMRFDWERALLLSDLDAHAKAMALILATYADAKGLAYPSVATLAMNASLSPVRTRCLLHCVFRSFRTPNPEFSYTSRWDRRPRSGRRCCEIRSS
jgi:hypothetical protein